MGLVKEIWKLIGSLDVFAVHGVGDIINKLLVAVFALEGRGGAEFGEGVTTSGQFVIQVTGVVATVAWNGVATLVICKMAGALEDSLRANDDEITQSLYLFYYGEGDYNFYERTENEED